VQEDTEKTIEAVLFDALLKTRLIESRATSNYHRCGRTDKGVSAFSQVTECGYRKFLIVAGSLMDAWAEVTFSNRTWMLLLEVLR